MNGIVKRIQKAIDDSASMYIHYELKELWIEFSVAWNEVFGFDDKVLIINKPGAGLEAEFDLQNAKYNEDDDEIVGKAFYIEFR